MDNNYAQKDLCNIYSIFYSISILFEKCVWKHSIKPSIIHSCKIQPNIVIWSFAPLLTILGFVFCLTGSSTLQLDWEVTDLLWTQKPAIAIHVLYCTNDSYDVNVMLPVIWHREIVIIMDIILGIEIMAVIYQEGNNLFVVAFYSR